MNQPPDRLQIEELRAQTLVGVFPHELERPREVIFFLDLEPLATDAFKTDSLGTPSTTPPCVSESSSFLPTAGAT